MKEAGGGQRLAHASTRTLIHTLLHVFTVPPYIATQVYTHSNNDRCLERNSENTPIVLFNSVRHRIRTKQGSRLALLANRTEHRPPTKLYGAFSSLVFFFDPPAHDHATPKESALRVKWGSDLLVRTPLTSTSPLAT